MVITPLRRSASQILRCCRLCVPSRSTRLFRVDRYFEVLASQLARDVRVPLDINVEWI